MKKKSTRPAKKKRGRRREGDIFKVRLEDGTFTYGRVLKSREAFYDYRSKEKELAAEDIVNLPILFQIPVMNSAFTSGRWEVVGSEELESLLLKPVKYFQQDAIDSTRFFIWEKGQSRPATRSECEGLECYAVWSANHVEDRLLDHYLGRQCKWMETVKIK